MKFVKVKRLAAALLAILLTLFVLQGCDTKGKPPEGSPPATDTGDTPEITEESTIYEKALSKVAPDTVIMKINGEDVKWEEFVFFLFTSIKDIESQYGEDVDWSAELYEGVTFNRYVIDQAAEAVLSQRIFWYGAQLLGIEMGAAEAALAAEQRAEDIESYGGEEEFAVLLRANFCTSALYDYLIDTGIVAQMCFDEMFGASGEKLSDEDAQVQAQAEDFMMAKHILISTMHEDDTLFDEDERAEAYGRAEALLNELSAYSGDDFGAFFDEKMRENTEDPGIASYPEGYLFQPGDMLEQFSLATLGLEPGQMSGIVETNYGYHIILRTPIDYDAVPIAFQYYGYTLRWYASYVTYDSVREGWHESIPIEYADAYDALKLEELFA